MLIFTQPYSSVVVRSSGRTALDCYNGFVGELFVEEHRKVLVDFYGNKFN